MAPQGVDIGGPAHEQREQQRNKRARGGSGLFNCRRLVSVLSAGEGGGHNLANVSFSVLLNGVAIGRVPWGRLARWPAAIRRRRRRPKFPSNLNSHHHRPHLVDIIVLLRFLTPKHVPWRLQIP